MFLRRNIFCSSYYNSNHSAFAKLIDFFLLCYFIVLYASSRIESRKCMVCFYLLEPFRVELLLSSIGIKQE